MREIEPQQPRARLCGVAHEIMVIGPDNGNKNAEWYDGLEDRHRERVAACVDRDAIVLIGGDKTGISGDRFYREYIPQAERILKEYLAEIEEEDNG